MKRIGPFFFFDFVRHIYYLLVNRKKYRQVWLTFKAISEYKINLQTENENFYKYLFKFHWRILLNAIKKFCLKSVTISKRVLNWSFAGRKFSFPRVSYVEFNCVKMQLLGLDLFNLFWERIAEPRPLRDDGRTEPIIYLC